MVDNIQAGDHLDILQSAADLENRNDSFEKYSEQIICKSYDSLVGLVDNTLVRLAVVAPVLAAMHMVVDGQQAVAVVVELMVTKKKSMHNEKREKNLAEFSITVEAIFSIQEFKSSSEWNMNQCIVDFGPVPIARR